MFYDEKKYNVAVKNHFFSHFESCCSISYFVKYHAYKVLVKLFQFKRIEFEL